MFVRVKDAGRGQLTWINTDHIRHIEFTSGGSDNPSSLLFWFASGEKAVTFIQVLDSFDTLSELIRSIAGEGIPTTQA